MKTYEYDSYQHYIDSQIATTDRKLGHYQWATKRHIHQICRHLYEHMDDVDNILCHGTRSGVEQQGFKECYPEANVIGTEISPRCSEFPMTMEWDFNKPLPFDIKFDVVYSNAFDHTFNPVETLQVWFDQLRPGGMMLIEYSFHRKHMISKLSDPTVVSRDELEELLKQYGDEVQTEYKKSDCYVFYYKKR